MYRFLHVIDNNILTKLYAFLLCQKNRSVVLSLKRSRDRPSRHAHSVVEKFTLSRRFSASFQLLEMEYAPSTGELPL